jgi:hypothetical protein
MTVLGIPDHRHAELDRLGVRLHCQVKRVKRGLPETKVDQWRKRGEECPF